METHTKKIRVILGKKNNNSVHKVRYKKIKCFSNCFFHLIKNFKILFTKQIEWPFLLLIFYEIIINKDLFRKKLF